MHFLIQKEYEEEIQQQPQTERENLFYEGEFFGEKGIEKSLLYRVESERYQMKVQIHLQVRGINP